MTAASLEKRKEITAMLPPQAVLDAAQRLKPHLHRTPLLESHLLNSWLGHEIVFKAECFQKTGAFKARGALNALLEMKERGALPERVVAYSSGNHAQGLAWAGKKLGVQVTLYITVAASAIKKQATRSYGAEVIETATRMEAEERVAEQAAKGMVTLPAFDNDMVIAGQGASCLEALQDGGRFDAAFAPCGGGGLVSGTWLAAQALAPEMKVFAAEPEAADDAARSVKSGSIFRFAETPKTLADGAATLSVSPRTFAYLQKLDGIYGITEEEILYWTQWVSHLLKISCEPTSALALAAAARWLKEQPRKSRVLVVLSGGNIAPETYSKIWQRNCLDRLPQL